ncbi:MAG TPA: hypothetical protein VF424_13325, partial [Vicinamibacterales bacterium]
QQHVEGDRDVGDDRAECGSHGVLRKKSRSLSRLRLFESANDSISVFDVDDPAYEARAVRRAVTRVVGAGAALAALARAIDRFFMVKQRSSARSTFSSTMVVCSRETSEI